MKKYYKLYRKETDLTIFNSYFLEISVEIMVKIKKRIKKDFNIDKNVLFLVEVTKNKDFTESITNIWLLPIGTPSIWLKYAKNNLIFDYTGLVLVIHKGTKVCIWDDYILNKQCG